MSHHLDAPEAAKNGQLYIDDLYVFADGDTTVLVMNVNSNITEPNVKLGFHPEARYEFKIHFDDAPYEGLTYRFSFGEEGDDGGQMMHLHALTGDDARRDDATGDQLLGGHTGHTVGGGDLRVWTGRVSDSFYIDLSLLARVNSAIKDGTAVNLKDWQPDHAKNSFAGTTVESIVLAISHRNAALQPGTRVGVWCATKLATDAGGWRQINRFGLPMMWPIFWPDDTVFSNPANTRHPSEDFDAIGGELAGQVAAVVAANGTETDPQGYAEAVVRRLLPEKMPYVIGTPATYGFAGINGRTLADNAPELMLSLVSGRAIPSGLTPAVAKHLRHEKFPYVVPT